MAGLNDGVGAVSTVSASRGGIPSGDPEQAPVFSPDCAGGGCPATDNPAGWN